MADPLPPLLLAVVLLALTSLPAGRPQDLDGVHHFLDDPDILEGDGHGPDVLGPPDSDVERVSFVQWILALLGYQPSKPPAQPLPQPIDPAQCKPCKCGLTNKQTRIVGGHVTYVNQYPWMSLLMYRGRFYCGATLLNSKYVLTAAHCVHGFSEDKISVRIYEHDRDTTNETEHIDRQVARIVPHSGYSEYSFNNDIALIALDKEVPIEGSLRPVCLPPPKKSFTGETGIVTGWGVKKAGGATSATLQEVQVPIMSNKACKNSSYGASRITDNMMCAGYPEGKKDSCQGDSGGPLHVILNQDVHHIAGVVSWGEGCAQADHPGVYTRVNRYLTWIEKNTRDSCFCQPFDHSTAPESPPPAATTAAPAAPAPVTEEPEEASEASEASETKN